MSFLAPGWLALFAPFAALVWQTLRRAPTTRPTTSAFLWPSSAIASARRATRRPPAWVIAALLSTASAIVALAAPARQDRAQVAVVVDPTFRATAFAPSAWARLARADVALTLVVPGQPDAMAISDVRPTARSTAGEVVATVARIEREGRDVAVVSEATIVRGEHVRVLAPTPPSVNASVERVGARSVAAGGVDVFVRVTRTSASPRAARLTVTRGDASVEQSIEWPADATSADAFVRLPRAAGVIEARVAMAGDAAPLDDAAWLAHDAASNVRVALDAAPSATLGRFAAAYARVRPADEATPSVDVTLTRDARLAGRAVIVADGPPIADGGATRRVEHPILADVDLDRLPACDATMPAGFEAIAWRGNRPTVATRDLAGRRAVWLGLDATAASGQPAWVVLLDQAIAWTADGADAWSAVTSDAVPSAGWRATRVADARVEASPGVYVDADGVPRAVNLPGATMGRAMGDDVDVDAWLASRRDRAARPLTAWPAIAAAALAAIAAGLAGTSRGRRAHLDVRAVGT